MLFTGGGGADVYALKTEVEGRVLLLTSSPTHDPSCVGGAYGGCSGLLVVEEVQTPPTYCVVVCGGV